MHDITGILNLHGFTNIVKTPTCFKGANPTLIDCILSNVPKRFQGCMTFDSGLSDHHHMICFATKMHAPLQREKYIKYRSYKRFNEEKYIDDLSSKLDILKILFNKYTFPLAFNKKKLNENFEAIIYFSFLNINDIVKIVEGDKIYLDNSILEIVPVKLKNLYFNLTKTYYQYTLCSLENITYNFKYYQDYIYIYVIKNIIQNNTIITNLFTNKEIFAKMIDTYQRNFILLQLVNDLNWSNLSKRLDYLHYIFKNENLIYYQNKLNKNLFGDTIDYKIKNIILDKFSMYKYLKKEKDFIKWTKFIKNNINALYEKKISVSDADLILLRKLIHKLYNVEVQDLKDSKYIDLVHFCQKNKKLILSENRINPDSAMIMLPMILVTPLASWSVNIPSIHVRVYLRVSFFNFFRSSARV